jgi:hypothetical protein
MIFDPSFKMVKNALGAADNFYKPGVVLSAAILKWVIGVSMKKSEGRGEMPGRDKRYSTQMGRQAATGGLGGGGGYQIPIFSQTFFVIFPTKVKHTFHFLFCIHVHFNQHMVILYILWAPPVRNYEFGYSFIEYTYQYYSELVE